MLDVYYPEQQQTILPPNPQIPIEGKILFQSSETHEQQYLLYTEWGSTGLFCALEVGASAGKVCTRTVELPLPDELEERVIHRAFYGDRIDYLRRMGYAAGIPAA